MDESLEAGRIGSSFDDFLDAEGNREEVEETAIKALIADQLQSEMKAQGLTKVAMARRMRTTRQQLGRLLGPKNPFRDLVHPAAGGEGRGSELDDRADVSARAFAGVSFPRLVTQKSGAAE